MKRINTKDLVLEAVFASICCVCSIITVPTGIVPVTLGTFGIMVTALILGAKRGTVSVLVFIALGAIGLPVFSGFQGGLGIIAGPTGGYIYGYILMVPIIAIFSKNLNKTVKSSIIAISGCIVAIIVLYIIGTIHFIMVMNLKNGGTTIINALKLCVLPFIPFDILKGIIAVLIGIRVKPLFK